MSALTVPARPDEDTALQPVPWRGMAWVVWRQHRVALIGVAVFLCALAVCLLLTGFPLHHAYTSAAACHPASSLGCGGLVSRFNRMDDFLANGSVMQAVPALIGAFAGAPMLARDLETGTFRYAWTQGFGRSRWALGKLVPLAAAVTVTGAALSVILDWYYEPYLVSGNQARSLSEASPLAATLFDLRGVAFAAWTLAAFTVGALAGMLIRRVVPAIAATLAGYAGIAFTAGYLRLHYLTPLITGAQNVPGSADLISQWGTRNGRFAFAGQPPLSLLQHLCTAPSRGVHVDKTLTIAQCLSAHGYTWWASYQPASRFWPLQLIEGSWLVALSALLIAATVWLVRRRAS